MLALKNQGDKFIFLLSVQTLTPTASHHFTHKLHLYVIYMYIKKLLDFLLSPFQQRRALGNNNKENSGMRVHLHRLEHTPAQTNQ